MNRQEITKKVVAIIAKQGGVDLDQVTLKKKLVEDLNFDSLDGVETVMEIEEEFDIIAITDAEAKQLLTPQQIVDYVDTRINPPKPPS